MTEHPDLTSVMADSLQERIGIGFVVPQKRQVF